MVENPTKRLHNVNAPNSTIWQQRGVDEVYRIMEHEITIKVVLVKPIKSINITFPPEEPSATQEQTKVVIANKE